jgi:hypothetical protein
VCHIHSKSDKLVYNILSKKVTVPAPIVEYIKAENTPSKFNLSGTNIKAKITIDIKKTNSLKNSLTSISLLATVNEESR